MYVYIVVLTIPFPRIIARLNSDHSDLETIFPIFRDIDILSAPTPEKTYPFSRLFFLAHPVQPPMEVTPPGQLLKENWEATVFMNNNMQTELCGCRDPLCCFKVPTRIRKWTEWVFSLPKPRFTVNRLGLINYWRDRAVATAASTTVLCPSPGCQIRVRVITFESESESSPQSPSPSPRVRVKKKIESESRI